jgi:hypothetical protein
MLDVVGAGLAGHAERLVVVLELHRVAQRGWKSGFILGPALWPGAIARRAGEVRSLDVADGWSPMQVAGLHRRRSDRPRGFVPVLADSPPMRYLSTWLFGAVLALLLAALFALLLAVEGAPRVPRRDEVAAADVDRAVAMLRQYDPRRAPPRQLHSLSLAERDIDLLVRHAARRWLGADTRISLQPGRLYAQASVAAPWGRWLNIELVLRQTAALPEVEGLRVGRLPLPSVLAVPLLRAFAAQRDVQADALLAVEWVERVTLASGRMQVSYRIDPDTMARLRAALVAPVDQQRLRAYTERLATLTQGVQT